MHWSNHNRAPGIRKLSCARLLSSNCAAAISLMSQLCQTRCTYQVHPLLLFHYPHLLCCPQQLQGHNLSKTKDSVLANGDLSLLIIRTPLQLSSREKKVEGPDVSAGATGDSRPQNDLKGRVVKANPSHPFPPSPWSCSSTFDSEAQSGPSAYTITLLPTAAGYPTEKLQAHLMHQLPPSSHSQAYTLGIVHTYTYRKTFGFMSSEELVAKISEHSCQKSRC